MTPQFWICLSESDATHSRSKRFPAGKQANARASLRVAMPQALRNAYDHLLDFRLFNPFGLASPLLPKGEANACRRMPVRVASPLGEGL
ncbi:hypothetical protein [Nostoc sp.]|uniref:hypothetical protein n=1 Tax=Nostoc sp. TaxID=1180 RepID=UPI002FF816E1